MKTATFTARSRKGVEIVMQAENTPEGLKTSFPVKCIPVEKVATFVIVLDHAQAKEFLGVDVPEHIPGASVALVDQDGWRAFDQECGRERYEAEQARKEEMFPGLSALENARNAEARYHEDFQRMMEDEFNDGVNPPKSPKVSSQELAKQYPKAAAYLHAEGWRWASHHVKSHIGEKAMTRLENGENYEQVIAEMEQEWSKYTADHIWD